MNQDYQYMVCIWCITYNHAPYILDTLHGFCSQETNFPVINVIIDDCSTDGEEDVIDSFVAKELDISDKTTARHEENDEFIMTFARHKKNKNCFFVIYYYKENHFSIKRPRPSVIEEWKEKAKYVALCEGDDYWIEPHKLQKQVDYMERYPEYGLVHTKAKVYNQTQKCFRGLCGRQDRGFEDVLLSNPVVTLTTCFRSSIFLQYLEERSEWDVRGWMMSDYPMWIWFAYHTKIYFLNEETAVYREVPNSMSHKSLDNRLRFIKSTEDIRLFFVYYYNLSERIKKEICYETNKKSASACLKYGDKKRAEEYLKELSCLDRWRIKKKYLF